MGLIFTDLCSRAVHIEVACGYSTEDFLLAFTRFVSIRGYPEAVFSDPGSQLVGADNELKQAWDSVDKEVLVVKGLENGLKWVFGPADSAWHQGAVESLVKVAKRSIHLSVHNQRLSVPEFLTVCAEVSNLINERPLGTMPSLDSSISILTPNSLILGRAVAKNPGGWQPQAGSAGERYRLVQEITAQFWKHWTELFAPSLVLQKKWRRACRSLKVGDVCLILESDTFKGDYRLGLVKKVVPGPDGKVRRVSLSYKNFKVGEALHEYKGAPDTVVERAAQRLVLLVPVEEAEEQQ